MAKLFSPCLRASVVDFFNLYYYLAARLRMPASGVTIRRMDDSHKKIGAKFVGVELYFSDLKRARGFYAEVLGLQIADEDETRYAKFNSGAAFVCLERKGSESYPSQDKAVLFFEVPDLEAAVKALGEDQFVQHESTWAVLHDPEGHNVLLLQR